MYTFSTRVAATHLLNKHSRKLLIALCIALSLPTTATEFSPAATSEPPSQTIDIRYPAAKDNNQHDFDDYFLALLKLGMEKSGEKFSIKPIAVSSFGERRAELLLIRNRFNLHWLNTNIQREKNLLPIPIPLFKGLIGWRLLLIKKEDQKKFSAINSIEQLRQVKAGQGHDWPDVNIIKFNGLPIVTSANWAGLFKMLQVGRIDYYPRSLIEIWREQKTFEALDLGIEDHLVLRYPAAYYFFTNKQNIALATALTKGLERARTDGSFDQLFMQHFGDYIQKATLNERIVIYMQNPNLAPINPNYLYEVDTAH